MKNRKISITCNIITIINILLIMKVFLMGLLRASLSTIISINIFFSIIVLLLQILNLILIKVGVMKEKKVTLIIIAIFIITFFIPVKKTGDIKYNYAINNKSEKIDKSNMWNNEDVSMIYTWEYKNLYGVTLKMYKETKDGINIFY